MTMWARIESGAVAEITEINPEGRFHPSIKWELCAAGVEPGWKFDGKSFSGPTLEPSQPLSREQVEAARLRAYADPITGSDRLFAEALRMQMMGESGWEEARDAAAARYQEIQNEYPWP